MDDGVATGSAAAVALNTEVLTGEAEAGDEVVAELPVYLCQGLSDELYLLQYPLTPAYRQVPAPTSAKMKPKHQLLEVDVPVPGPPHLDEEAEGRTNVRTMKFASTSVPPKAQTMIGVVHEGALFLSPVKSTLQMRPQFDYLDAAGGSDSDSDGEDETKGTEGRPAKLQTQIKRRESRRTVEARQHSYTAHAQSLDEDAAVPLRVLAEDDEARAAKVAQLHATVETEVPVQDGSEYIEKFAQPVPPEVDGDAAPLTLQQLATMPPDVQVREIMRRAQALTFSQVCSCVTRGVPPETIRANLETVARVVHGCWVLKSDLCVAGRNVHVRDYILLQIMASPTRSVSRLDVCDATCSRKQDVTAILKGFCRLNVVSREWEFKATPDPEYAARNKTLIIKQQEAWRSIADGNPYVQARRLASSTGTN